MFYAFVLVMIVCLVADVYVRNINRGRALTIAASVVDAENAFVATRSLHGYYARRTLPEPSELPVEIVETIGGLACLGLLLTAWLS